MKKGVKTGDENRRKFLKILTLSGATLAFSPEISFSQKQQENEITAEMIEAAEKIIGIELTAEERIEVIKAIKQMKKSINMLRERNIADDVPPSMVFNPVPPGTEFPKEKKEPKFSQVKIKKFSSIESLGHCSVLELAKLIETGKVTSTALTKMFLARLKKYNPTLNFVVNYTEERALRQARKADDEINAGKYRGPLHGIPYGIKDLFSAKGYPTTWGTGIYKDRIIDKDASVVEKLEKAGAVLIAKLATGTLASGSVWFGGDTKNPWRPKYGAGGSSAGPASAIAAGCVPFSIGTETNGSMVSPCDTCGVTGFRPTFGRVSRIGAMTVSWSFDKVTPICRTVEDCAAVFNAIYGPDGKDNSIIDLPFNWDSDIDIGKLRIGYHTKFFEKELMGNPKSEYGIYYRKKQRAASLNVLEFFKKLGITLIPLDFEGKFSGEGYMLEIEAAAYADRLTRSKMDDRVEDQKWPRYHRRSRFWPAVDYIQSSRYRSLLIQDIDKYLKDVDLYIEITWSNNWYTNSTGHPIVVLPCGFIDENRPVSITFVGKLFAEATLLAAAKKFQDATDYHLKHPKMFL
jgi:Asp-tRNA(Asn)/Glu-tRNA(Gln) amidotransferase A subunit family amidase